MSREPSTPPKQRLFVALDLPEDVRAGLAAWSARELVDEVLRPVSAESLHVTLCFLGWTEAAGVDEGAALVRNLRPRPVPMTLRSTPVAKPPSRPRLFALDLEAPAAIELQAEVAAELAGAGLYEPEERPFWPHITVARVRRRGRGDRPLRRLRKPPGDLPAALVHTFASVRVALYRSNLRPEGAHYTTLANLNLPLAS